MTKYTTIPLMTHVFGIVIGLWLVVTPAAATTEVNVSFFYDRLAVHGHGVSHAHYGRVWYPATVPVGWRPYTYGHWVWTDDYGWLWDSEEDWGWATYHYGRWADDPEYGWVWIPGTVWGPAWVTWRWGGGYAGWAPLPPAVGWNVGVGLGLAGIDLDVAVRPLVWVFVEERVFIEPRIRAYIIPPARNVTIINVTKNVTKYETVGGRVVNHGVSVEHIEQITHTRLTRWRVRDADTVAEARAGHLSHGEVAVFRPTVKAATPDHVPPGSQDTDRIRAAQQADLREHHEAEERHLRDMQSSASGMPASARSSPDTPPERTRPGRLRGVYSERVRPCGCFWTCRGWNAPTTWQNVPTDSACCGASAVKGRVA